MELAPGSGKMWHFANYNHCGWAQMFKQNDVFDETIVVS